MLTELSIVSGQDDPEYLALHGRLGLKPVNVRVARQAIDDLDEFSGAPDATQRAAFARHNLKAFRHIAQAKIDRGDAELQDWHGREALFVRVTGADIANYLSQPGNRLSFAAFNRRMQPKP